MTTVYGSWAPNSTTNKRVRLILDYTVPTPAAGATSVTVAITCKVQTRYGVYDVNNTFARSGFAGSMSKSVSIDLATDGTQTLESFTRSVSLTDARQALRIDYSLTGVEYIGISTVARVGASLTIPARVYASPPPAPTSVTATRSNDALHTLRWTQSGSSHTGFDLQQWSAATGAWQAIGTPSTSSRSWQIKNTVANERYQWRIRAKNSAGASAWAYSPFRRTTPGPATNVTLERSGDTLVARWTPRALHGSHQDVQVSTSPDGSTWSPWQYGSGLTGLAMAASNGAFFPLDVDMRHRVRIQTAITTETDGAPLYSHSSPSGALLPLAPPSAPTLLAPAGTVAAGGGVTLEWRHNPRDGSRQAGYEVRVRGAGTDTWTTLSGIDASARELSAGDVGTTSGTYEWQARTLGAHVDWGPWSGTGLYRVAERPVVTILSPAGGHDSNRIVVELSYSDPEGEAATSYSATLLRDGQVVASQTSRSPRLEIPAILEDGETYTVRATATSGSGLTSQPTETTFNVAFALPWPPYITAEWRDEEGAVGIAVDNTESLRWDTINGTWADAEGAWENAGGSYTSAVTNRIERSIDGGATWVTIGDLPLYGGMADDEVPLGSDVLYRAVAISALGVESPSNETQVTTSQCHAWITSPGGRFRITWNPVYAAQHGQEHVVEQYVGRTHPVSHYGPGRSTIVTVEAAELEDDGSMMQPWEQVLHGHDVLWRDPTGLVMHAAVRSGPDYRQSEPQTRTISMSLERVHG